jgi:hypothetical protein
MRLLRGSPELREVLQVTEEGVPVAAVERRHEEHPEAVIDERRHEESEAMRGDDGR